MFPIAMYLKRIIGERIFFWEMQRFHQLNLQEPLGFSS